MAPTIRKGGLGRGLDALFDDVLDSNNTLQFDNSEAQELRLSLIVPDRSQPRNVFDDDSLSELSSSILEHGVLQPILVRPAGDGTYRIVAGERRWRACRLAGLNTIPVIIRDLSDADSLTIALVENLQREDLNPIDEALGYRQLMDLSGCTQDQLAKRVGKSRSTVTNALRLLLLPPIVVDLLKSGDLTAGHAKALLAFQGTEKQAEAALLIARDGLSVREAEKMSQQLPHKTASQPRSSPPRLRDSIASEVELSLKDALGVEVHVKYQEGKGVLSVSFYTKEQLYEFANRLGYR